GSPLLELASAASQLEWVALQGEIAELLQELQQLRQRQTIDATSAYQIPAKQERLVELRAREKLMARELAALVQHAPYGGYLLKSPLGLAPALTAPRDDRFRPHPLDPASLGCSLERSALLGWFSPKQQLSLTALLPERDVKKLRIGTPVSIQWDSALSQIGQGEIRRIAPDPASETPAELVGDPSLHSIRDEQGRFQPETPHYQVTIEVVSSVPHPLRGAPATIQIPQPPQTLFERGMHYLRQNLKPIY
ncbi:MAG: hypothetical protein KDA45_08040, partial [Planctomycetales bacterium]|nr:hypothetical protein [Planctomycetales bacterium]